MGNTDLRYQATTPGEAETLRAQLPDFQTATALGRQAQALSDSNRLILLALLVEAGELCVSDLCLITEREQSGVSRHLRILWDRGLVEKERRGVLLFYRATSLGEQLLRALLPAAD
ncbi:MAG TPA: metalloregulator ArsR/SmtB family transcription factor [Solirubrobacterales bacterium]|nr:metalloregulator ArsR/SmtB family transcription factor [Solirubrobacterales bacterium]